MVPRDKGTWGQVPCPILQRFNLSGTRNLSLRPSTSWRDYRTPIYKTKKASCRNRRLRSYESPCNNDRSLKFFVDEFFYFIGMVEIDKLLNDSIIFGFFSYSN